MKRRLLFVVATVVVLIPAGNRPPGARADEPKDNAKPTASLEVYHPGSGVPLVVQVGLYQDGKLIRAREVNANSNVQDKVTWAKLPVGPYEVHFEAPGYGTFVKRVLLSEDDPPARIVIQLERQPMAVGLGGPSLQELSQELQKVKKANAELQAQMQVLREAVEQLKKK
jgi:hypothetical protein